MPALALALVLAGPASAEQVFHTSPWCWREPRIAHGGESLRELRIERVDGLLAGAAEVSPNGAYRFRLVKLDIGEPGPWTADLLVDNERPYHLRLRLEDTHRDAVEARWIGEKLVYVRVWWGRIAGSDLIVDVEKEAIVLDEGFYYGAIAHQQFQACADPAWRGEPQCECFPGAPEGWRPAGAEPEPDR